jgi:threonine dehydratase
LLDTEQLVVEGSGVVGVSALVSGKLKAAGRKVVAVVLSGGNIDVGLLLQVMQSGYRHSG